MDVNKLDKRINGCWLACVFLTLTGCETPPSAVEANFGSSVRNAIALQTAQPGQRVTGLDGVKGEVVLRTYQSDVARPEKVERDFIQINLGE